MGDEKRRYFRIDETIGINYERIDHKDLENKKNQDLVADIYSLVTEQDERIDKLLSEIADENPKVGELIMIFNQKIERIVNQLLIKSELVNRVARKVREVNISACGMAFINDEPIEIGERLQLEMTLYPSETKIQTLARVISADVTENNGFYYWRLDFYAMNVSSQELLIQHIVKSQSIQLKGLRG